ncbi:uncharacterized protein TNCV_577401 [Trichonephila clavipes]|nr:uncharacterized protein TNCV_577401 [Trichonephila clavipes]
MAVCKCLMPSRRGCTLNSHRAASPLVRLMEVVESWEAPHNHQGVLPQNWRLKLNGKLLGMIGMRGIRTLSPLASPVKIVDFTICLPNSVIRNRVPLHNLGASKLRINKTGTPTFKSN